MAASAPRTVGIPLSLAGQDVSSVCERLRALLEDGGPTVVVCDVTGVDRPDAATLETLARLQLTARRFGSRLVLSCSGPQVERLLVLAGLTGLFTICPQALQAGRQPEQGEQALGVEEEAEPGDPSV